MSSSANQSVFLCKECKGSGTLAKFLHQRTDASIKTVGCQDVCKEPVCGLRVNGRLEWFGGLDKPKRQKALAALLAHPNGGVPSELAGARAGKRSGKKPR